MGTHTPAHTGGSMMDDWGHIAGEGQWVGEDANELEGCFLRNIDILFNQYPSIHF